MTPEDAALVERLRTWQDGTLPRTRESGRVRAELDAADRIEALSREKEEAEAHCRNHHVEGGCMTCMEMESGREQAESERDALREALEESWPGVAKGREPSEAMGYGKPIQHVHALASKALLDTAAASQARDERLREEGREQMRERAIEVAWDHSCRTYSELCDCRGDIIKSIRALDVGETTPGPKPATTAGLSGYLVVPKRIIPEREVGET